MFLYGCIYALSTTSNISSKFPRISEASASEILGNLEEMFPLYYTHVCSFNHAYIVLYVMKWLVVLNLLISLFIMFCLRRADIVYIVL